MPGGASPAQHKLKSTTETLPNTEKPLHHPQRLIKNLVKYGLALVQLVGRDGESLAAFAAATRDHLTAGGRCHAFAESVFVAALSVRRLECSFHRGVFWALQCR